MEIIGISGLKRSGKNTVGNYIADKYGFEERAFATKLKEAIKILNPLIPYVRDGAFFNPAMRYSEALDYIGEEEAKGIPEVRRLLQVFGTEVARELFGENFWVEQLERTLEDNGKYVITDVRFCNEAEFILENGGRLS